MTSTRRVRVIPGRLSLVALLGSALGVLVALLAGLAVAMAAWVAWACVAIWLVVAVLDYARSHRAWRRSPPTIVRRLPAAFAIGVRRPVHLVFEIDGTTPWHCRVYDHAPSILATEGLPLRLDLPAVGRVETGYAVTPTRRGEGVFEPAELRVRSRWGWCEFIERVGPSEMRRVYPDFAQVARYAWLAGDHRLREIGVKTYRQRGEGTDFKQLSEYRPGDSVRHLDWRATVRMGKPIVREFQDERDQCVLLLVDCGRRMRADDRDAGIGTTHFDQVLNAIMLLAYVALKHGDAVGAMTFGTPAGDARSFAPQKGTRALNALMAELYAVQPTPTHADYLTAAQDVMRRQRRRALVILVTNFRDEDSTELGLAVRLLRSRHRLLIASLRERIVSELMEQSPTGPAAVEIASAHLYEQSRRDAFNRLAALNAITVDAEPERLGIDLVNRYHAIRSAGTF